MPINNSYDIYNATLEQDKVTVDLLVTDIKEKLEENIIANVNIFDYDLQPTIGELPTGQQNRIVDRVIYYLRSNGIRVKIKSVNRNDAGEIEVLDMTGPYFPFYGSTNYTLTISWWSRNNQEYMKTYC